MFHCTVVVLYCVFLSVMVEGHGKEVSEDVFCEAVRVGMEGVS